MKPVIRKERKPQHAALGNPGEGVHVVQAEGQKGAGEKGDEAVFQGKGLYQIPEQNKTSLS